MLRLLTMAFAVFTACNAFYLQSSPPYFLPTHSHMPSVIVWNVHGPALPFPANTAAAAPIAPVAPITNAVPETASVAAQISAPVSALAVEPEVVSVSASGPVAQPISTESASANTSATAEEASPPQPYNFGYRAVDNFGTTLTRNETRNEYDVVVGSYSYLDKEGISRTVDYVADKDGFRAQIRTSEPGTQTSEPANVKIQSNAVLQ